MRTGLMRSTGGAKFRQFGHMRPDLTRLCLLAALLAGAWAGAGLAPAKGQTPGSAAPADFGFPAPDPEPALPAGFDAFEPPLLPLSANAPAIAEASKTAGPDETIVLSGVGFRANAGIRVFSQTKGAGPNLSSGILPWTADGLAAAILLPHDLPPWSMYLVWPSNAKGVGAPVAVNRTEAWWAGPQPAQPGGTVSLHGRNLSRDNGTAEGSIYLKPQGRSAGSWAQIAAVSPYRIDFLVPPGLPDGDYEIWAHNGHGGRFGWSGPITLALAPSPWADQTARVFDVRDQGAKGDGAADDTASIQATLDLARAQAPATVRFPTGVYMISRGLNAPNGVAWVGEGRDKTIIRAFPASSETEPNPRTEALVYADGDKAGNNVAISDLSFDLPERHRDTNSPGYNPDYAAIYFNSVDHLRLDRVRIRAATAAYFNVNGSRDVRVEGSEFVGSRGSLGTARRVFIENCRFFLTYRARAAILARGGQEISITGNQAEDLDSSRPEGTAEGRFFVSQGHNSGTQDIFVSENTTIDLAPPSPEWSDFDPNTGEQILFEQVGTNRFEAIISAGPDTATLSSNGIVPEADKAKGKAGDADQVKVGNDVMIVAGKGAGQYRRIVEYSQDGRELRVDRPWTVVPDSNSSLVVVNAAVRVVVYRNRLDGKSFYATEDTASSGVQFYGNSADIVVDGNVMTHMRGGIELWALGHGALNPVFFNLVVNNEIDDSYDGLVAYTKYLKKEKAGAIGHLGNVFRNNRGDRLAHAGVNVVTWQGYEAGAYSMEVFEGNRFADAHGGVMVGSDPQAKAIGLDPPTPITGIVLYRNDFARGSAPYTGSRGRIWPGRATLIDAENSWKGFEVQAVTRR